MWMMLGIGLLPPLLASASWWLQRSNAQRSEVHWRRALFLVGLVCVSVSVIVLTAFNVHAYVISRGTTPYDLDRAYPVLWMMGFALLASILACCGRRLSRLLLLGTGLLTFCFWYIVALAASP
jgi:hypothetical protein